MEKFASCETDDVVVLVTLGFGGREIKFGALRVAGERLGRGENVALFRGAARRAKSVSESVRRANSGSCNADEV